MFRIKIILPLVIALALLAGGGYLYKKNSDKQNPATPTAENNNGVSDDAKNNEETINELKESLSDDSSKDQSEDQNSQKSVKPVITYSGQYQGNIEVNSHVPGVFEKSGKCTLDLKKDGKTVSQNKTAVPNVSEMSCGVIKIPTSKLSGGNWSATVTYSSAKANGASDKFTIEVK